MNVYLQQALCKQVAVIVMLQVVSKVLRNAARKSNRGEGKVERGDRVTRTTDH